MCDFTCILPCHSWEYSLLNVGDASEELIYSWGISLINTQVRKVFYDRNL